MRLLLVEDDALLGEGLVDGLTEAGFLVDWLRDGLSAITALQTQHSFDIMVLDIGLPGKNGFQVLQWIRGQRMLLPILLLTARDALEDRVQGLNAGADDYLIKPFALTELVARLRVLLRRQHQQPTNTMSGAILNWTLPIKAYPNQGHRFLYLPLSFAYCTFWSPTNPTTYHALNLKRNSMAGKWTLKAMHWMYIYRTYVKNWGQTASSTHATWAGA